MWDLYTILVHTQNIAVIPSTICLIIHIWKFFRSGKISTQSLATTNLTFYCFLLLLYITFYAFDYFGIWSDRVLENYYIYISLSIMIFKLIIAIDMCLCFRKIALYLQSPTAENKNRKFYIYSCLGTSIPLLYFLPWTELLCEGLCGDIKYAYYTYMTFCILRVCRLIPTVSAFWYLHLASIDKTELWSKFSLHIRVLVILGGLAASFSMIQLYRLIIIARYITSIDNYSETELENAVDQEGIFEMHEKFFEIQDAGTIIEGIVIGIFFTFKKDTFRSVHSSH